MDCLLMSTQTPLVPGPTDSLPVAPRPRWRFLDTLRGFAIFGILLVNARDITGLGNDLARPSADPVLDTLFLTVQTRFVPIFVLLFGISMWLVLDAARARRTTTRVRPWQAMVLRMVSLTGIGLILWLAYPGNVLLEYGVFGLLMLPIVLLAPRWLILATGVAGTIAAYALFGGGLPATPGLILLGAAAAAYGLPRLLETSTRTVLVVFIATGVLTVPALMWQLTVPGDPRFSTPGGIAGGIMAVLYVTCLALLWHTPVRRVIDAVFEPLGRMALTNYFTAAVVLALAALVIDFGRMTSVLPSVVLTVVVISAQSVLSRLWLGTHAYGPIEWVWRAATWLRLPAFRLTTR